MQSSVHFHEVNTPEGLGFRSGNRVPNTLTSQGTQHCSHPPLSQLSTPQIIFFLLLNRQEDLLSLGVRSISFLLSFPGGQLWDDLLPTRVSRTTRLGRQTPQQPWAPVSGILLLQAPLNEFCLPAEIMAFGHLEDPVPWKQESGAGCNCGLPERARKTWRDVLHSPHRTDYIYKL